MKFNTVVFDYGNVLTLWEPYNAVREKYTKDEFNQFIQDVEWKKLIELWDAGEKHQETLDRIIKIDEEKGTNWSELYRLYIPRFCFTIQNHVPGMFEIIRDLQAKDIKTYGLTNWSYEDIETAKKNVPAIALMQGMVVSGVEKVTKPSPEIYKILFKRYNIDPTRAIFIDDREDNIETFESFGGKGFLQERPFEDGAVKFRKFLQDCNVL